MPIWPFSKIMRGNKDKNIEILEEKEKKEIKRIKDKYDAEINELKKEFKKLEINNNKNIAEVKQNQNDDPIGKLDSLKEKELITEEEYEIKKKEIIDRH